MEFGGQKCLPWRSAIDVDRPRIGDPLDDCRSRRLLVIEGADDRAMIECDDGCWLSQMVPALGLTAEDLFNSIDDIYIGTEAPRYESPENLRAG